jgi:hypothetical protein
MSSTNIVSILRWWHNVLVRWHDNISENVAVSIFKIKQLCSSLAPIFAVATENFILLLVDVWSNGNHNWTSISFSGPHFHQSAEFSATSWPRPIQCQTARFSPFDSQIRTARFPEMLENQLTTTQLHYPRMETMLESQCSMVFSNQWVNPATSSPADDVHHYITPQSYYWPIDSIFNKLPVFTCQWGKEKVVLYLVEVPPP